MRPYTRSILSLESTLFFEGNGPPLRELIDHLKTNVVASAGILRARVP
jgi:hypothetical protein